ncbi:MAG: aquaporin Z [Lacisediminihabitans sp.]
MADSPAPALHSLTARLIAEAVGTFFLVVALIGTAIFTSSYVGILGVALSIGLVVLVGAYAFGPISGGHFNPAVTLGVAAAGRLPWKDVLPYIGAQLVGGIVGSSLLALIALDGPKGFSKSAHAGGFAANGFGDHSPAGYGLIAAIVAEIVLTALFLYVILGVTHLRAAAGFAPIAIGLTLTIIHLVSIPIDNTSVNPARSIATAIYGGPDFLAQLWVFILAPIAGALLAGVTFRFLFDRKPIVGESSYLDTYELSGEGDASAAPTA